MSVQEGQVEQAGIESQMSFEIIDGLDLGKQRRGGRNGSGAKYPIEKLAVGQSFFVAASEKVPDPLKTLGSAVTAVKMKYATQTGTEVKTLPKRGGKNKVVVDENGNKIMEQRQVKVYQFSRKFTLRGMKSGQIVGSWVAPGKGVLVQRIL